MKWKRKIIGAGFGVIALLPILMMTSLVGQKGNFYEVADNNGIEVNEFVDMSSKEAEEVIMSLTKEDEKLFKNGPVTIEKIKNALALEQITYSDKVESIEKKEITLMDYYDYDFSDRQYERAYKEKSILEVVETSEKSYESEEYPFRVPWQVMVTIDFLLDDELIGYTSSMLQSYYIYAYAPGDKPHFKKSIKTTDYEYVEIDNHQIVEDKGLYIRFNNTYHLDDSGSNYTTYYKEDKEVVVIKEYDYDKGEGYELEDKEKSVLRTVQVKEPEALIRQILTPLKTINYSYRKNTVEDELIDRRTRVKVHRNDDKEITGKTVTTTSRYLSVSELVLEAESQDKDDFRYMDFLDSVGLSGREEDVLQFSSLHIGGTEAVTELLSVSDSSLLVISDMYFSGLSYTELELTPTELAAPIPRFFQNDARWSQLPYGKSTIGSGGCGPTSMAMILTGLTRNVVSPVEMAYLSAGNGYKVKEGTSWGFFDFAARRYGISVKQLAPSGYGEVMEALKNGNPVIATVGPGHFTSDGHIIVLVAIDEDGIIINDPFDPYNKKNKSWDPRIVINEASQYFIFSKPSKEVS